MIEVTVTLHGLEEVSHFLEALRKGAAPEPEPSAPNATTIAAMIDAATGHVEPLELGPAPITDADLEAAITAYWKKMGLPAAKAVLAKYEVERVGAIPANRRGEAMLDMAV